jgi:hypothetical protein
LLDLRKASGRVVVDLVARQLGNTLMVLWTTPKGLGRRVTAAKGATGAYYHREVVSGEWRSEHIRGSSRKTFTELSQLTHLVTMMYARD